MGKTFQHACGAACILLTITLGTPAAQAQVQDAIIFKDYKTVALCFTPDGKTLVTGSQSNKLFGSGVILLFDVATWKKTHTLTMEGVILRSLALSPDGKKLAAVGHDPDIMNRAPDGHAHMWDLTGAKPAKERTYAGSYGPFYQVAFSHDSKRIAFGKSILDVATWQKQEQPKNFWAGSGGLAFSPDGKLIACGGSYRNEKADRDWGVTCLFDLTAGKLDGELHMGRAGYIMCLAFTPDGKTLATGGGVQDDPELKLWDMATRQVRAVLKGHADWINAVAISPDGKTLASASRDKTVRLWDAPTGKLLATLQGHTDAVLTVAFHPDGNWLISSAADGTVRQWALPR
jgi:WD40 repeat protein